MTIEINNLKKCFGTQTALDIPSLTIGSGEVVGLVGNNGAGKTTMLRLMTDLLPADEGSVMMGGCQVCHDERWKQFTGSFIDDHFLIDFYTPEEYFQFIADLYGITPDQLQERLQSFEALMHGEILGTGKYIHYLSQGNRQKTGIIGAMITHPKILLLDEPFNYLDPSSQIIVADQIKRLNTQLGCTTVVSSHNLNFVSEISTRILLLEKGQIVKDLPNEGSAVEAELNSYFAQQAASVTYSKNTEQP